jgi:hypothetical protein
MPPSLQPLFCAPVGCLWIKKAVKPMAGQHFSLVDIAVS